MKTAGLSAASTALVAVSVALLSACTSDDSVSSCPIDNSTLNHGVVVSVRGATPTSPSFAYPPPSAWVGMVCIDGACLLDSAQSGDVINVRDTAVGTSGAVVVTAAVADDSGRVGPAVTSTVTPTRFNPNGPTCGPTNYVATVTVTATR